MPSPSPLTSGWRGLFGRAPGPARATRVARVRDDEIPTAANSSALGWTRLGEAQDNPCAPSDAFARRRRDVAEEIARELGTRPDLHDAPAAVQAFLLRTWPRVIAHARLAGRTADERERYVAAVDELLWSVRKDATLRRPSHLMRLVPRLLETLREGVALLGGRQEADSAGFFSQLERLHRPVLKLCELRRQDSPPTPVRPVTPEQLLQSLHTGAWVELYSRQRWIRARLHWVDPQARQYLFCSAHGGLHALSRRLLETLVRDRRIRPARSPAPG